MVACPYLTKEGIELNTPRKITYLRTPTYKSLFVYLLRKARGSSCSCVHLQYILTETLVPSALCYNVQLYIHIFATETLLSVGVLVTSYTLGMMSLIVENSNPSPAYTC